MFTQDLAGALRFAESARAGWVKINDGTDDRESRLPFGGHAGSQSGIWQGWRSVSIERMTELKAIINNLG